MTIEYATGNILDTDAAALVVPVNTRGVMGAGLAKQVADRWPAGERAYKSICQSKALKPGEVWPYSNAGFGPALWYFATKDHWRDPSRLEWIDQGLTEVAHLALQWWREEGVAVPALGCGLGGLPWADVEPLIVKHLGPLDRRVVVYAPQAGNR